MTPESIAGLSIPAEQLRELIDALAATHDDNVVPLPTGTTQTRAA